MTWAGQALLLILGCFGIVLVASVVMPGDQDTRPNLSLAMVRTVLGTLAILATVSILTT